MCFLCMLIISIESLQEMSLCTDKVTWSFCDSHNWQKKYDHSKKPSLGHNSITFNMWWYQHTLSLSIYLWFLGTVWKLIFIFVTHFWFTISFCISMLLTYYIVRLLLNYLWEFHLTAILFTFYWNISSSFTLSIVLYLEKLFKLMRYANLSGCSSNKFQYA